MTALYVSSQSYQGKGFHCSISVSLHRIPLEDPESSPSLLLILEAAARSADVHQPLLKIRFPQPFCSKVHEAPRREFGSFTNKALFVLNWKSQIHHRSRCKCAKLLKCLQLMLKSAASSVKLNSTYLFQI